MNGIEAIITSILNYSIGLWSKNFGIIVKMLTKGLGNTYYFSGMLSIIQRINSLLIPTGIALVAILFYVGVIAQYSDFREVKQPTVIFSLFTRYILSCAFVYNSYNVCKWIFDFIRTIVGYVANGITLTSSFSELDKSIIEQIADLDLLAQLPMLFIALIATVIIIGLSYMILLKVYSRFFKIFIYVAIAPLPLATLASKTTSDTAKTFVKSFIGLCLQALVIFIACLIYNTIITAPSVVGAGSNPTLAVLKYVSEMIYFMFILNTIINSADAVERDMIGR